MAAEISRERITAHDEPKQFLCLLLIGLNYDFPVGHQFTWETRMRGCLRDGHAVASRDHPVPLSEAGSTKLMYTYRFSSCSLVA